MFCDLVARRLLNRGISIFEADTQGVIDFLHAATYQNPGKCITLVLKLEKRKKQKGPKG